ncbi:MAG: hypothetical protein LC792_09370, partial [Actinobacteria bacterium]|nr:hypothetical protein [Actinomycetota bacterium]
MTAALAVAALLPVAAAPPASSSQSSPPAEISAAAVRSLEVGAGDAVVLDNGRLALLVSETDQEQDLNGDGDRLDTVVQVLDTGTGQVTNLGVAPFAVEPLAGGGLAVQVDEHR